jgi:hypothetical protein
VPGLNGNKLADFGGRGIEYRMPMCTTLTPFSQHINQDNDWVPLAITPADGVAGPVQIYLDS